ncbi:MarR family winged helix-turn-helix transcriptional regulator [Antrihabitans cavernicola]|uniref:MarR family transcriptional regulator n=1 Tax=Antrihabitans cavernicola TaxID=2495913 RepID=A0A5A7SAZ0_9NOCA|nr:MarR family transcriptional regulator [Spelaeibacter cavernicola]KAA0021695.1 MarR family transcriptional regulator [Spelaeibacter cavernicola]
MPELQHGDLISNLFGSLGRFRRQVRRLAGGSFEQSNLSGSQAEFLRLIGRNPGISVKEAAAELGLVANSVSTFVTTLAGADLLVRQKDPDDRRVGRLTLTVDAQRVADETRQRRHELLSFALNSLSEDERSDLDRGVRVLAKLTDILHEQEESEK